MEIDLRGQIFEQDDSGNWIHKAEKSSIALQKNGKLKPKYKDLPRFKMIYKYEDRFNKQFQKTLAKINYQIKNQINDWQKSND